MEIIKLLTLESIEMSIWEYNYELTLIESSEILHNIMWAVIHNMISFHYCAVFCKKNDCFPHFIALPQFSQH